MNPLDIIHKYYPEDNELRRLLIRHSRDVADKALRIVDTHPELHLDRDFVEAGACFMTLAFTRPMPLVFIVMASVLISSMAG